MRHLVVGEACPVDGAPAGRVHCSPCPAFVSYRSQDGTATVGCSWGDDVAGWLRREMTTPPRPTAGPVTTVVPSAPRSAGRGPLGPTAAQATGPAPARRGLFGRMSLLFVAAFGVGVALSTYERG